MRAFAVFILVAIMSLAAGPTTLANDSSTLQLEITPRKCTFDILTTGVSQFTTVHPEDCQITQETARQTLTIPNQSASIAESALVSPDDFEGSQGIFEDTAIESLASLLGIGDKNGSSTGPITTSLALLLTTGVIVDAAFFRLRFTGSVWTFLGRFTNGTLRLLQRGVSR